MGVSPPRFPKIFYWMGNSPALFYFEVAFGIIIQLLLKSLNTPADLLSQLLQSISLILRLYACSTSAILIASVQRPASQNF